MRDPINIIEVQFDDDVQSSILKFNTLPKFDGIDYNLSDDKEFKKYILNIKYLVRHSFEYERLVQYLRENLDMNKCSIYSNVTNKGNNNIKIHIHHEPFTIEDIIYIVVSKRQYNMEELDVELVAEEVCRLHYQLRVGLIPLAETVHQLVHNSYLFIPTTAVMGKYWEFVEMYKPYIDQSQLDMLKRIEEYSKDYDPSDNLKLLEKNFIYVDIDDNNYSSQEVIDMMKSIVREEYKKNNII